MTVRVAESDSADGSQSPSVVLSGAKDLVSLQTARGSQSPGGPSLRSGRQIFHEGVEQLPEPGTDVVRLHHDLVLGVGEDDVLGVGDARHDWSVTRRVDD